MSWSREDDQMLKLGVVWGDKAEEVAAMLSKEIADVLNRASELRLPIKQLAMTQQAQPHRTVAAVEP
jgi:hypothetical protein